LILALVLVQFRKIEKHGVAGDALAREIVDWATPGGKNASLAFLFKFPPFDCHLMFGIRDKETTAQASVSWELLTSAPAATPRRVPCPLRVKGQILRTCGRRNSKSHCKPAAYRTYCVSPAQLTWSFQSTKGPWGLGRHAQTWSSKNAFMV
jgi:hypothetical protein